MVPRFVLLLPARVKDFPVDLYFGSKNLKVQAGFKCSCETLERKLTNGVTVGLAFGI